jgi:SAM-dependent methyltransferase
MTSRKQLQLFDDHYEMLADSVRMEAYAEAIQRAVRPGDRVLDLGCGLGILGFMALKAGASKVYAVEKTDSIELARAIAERNGLSDRVEFFHGSSKDFELDQPVDVLVSETLGSFGVEENTLDFTLDARRRLLKPGGRMVPQGLRAWLAPVCNARACERLDFWSRPIQGLDFSPAREELLSRMSTASIAAEDLLASPQIFAEVDLRSHEQVALGRKLLFPIERPGTLHGVAGWFDLMLDEQTFLSTSPALPPTHWKQAVFPLREAPVVVAGDYFELTLAIGPQGPRSDDTRVQMDFRCTQISG